MTLEGAINLNETNDYIIYTMNSVTTGQYGVVVPKNVTGTLNMLVDLHMKSAFDGVGNGSKTKEQLISEISEEYKKLKIKYVDGVLVMPMIDEAMFQNTVAIGDKQKMFDEVKKIGAITSELYKKLTESGIEKQKIDQKIIIVEKNQDDEKFVEWLKGQMPNFVDGILYSELTAVQEITNPFVDNGNSIFGPAPEVTSKVEEPVASNSGGIFDNITPVATPVTPAEPVVAASVESEVASAANVNVSPVEPVVASNPTENVSSTGVDIFGIPLDVKGVENNDTNASNNVVQSEPVMSSNVTEAPVIEEPKPVVNATATVEPKPVASAPLEGTTTFSPISNPVDVSTNNVSETSSAADVKVTEHASKGFANLIILLVILVGVTLVSIELGKFLYNVYGA